MHILSIVDNAIKYLVAAQESFQLEKSDQKFTCLKYDLKSSSIVTDPLGDLGVRFAVNFEFGSIDILHPKHGELASYPLLNARHLDIVNWLERERELLGFEEKFEFDLIEKTGFTLVPDDYCFPKPTADHYTKLATTVQKLVECAKVVSVVFDSVNPVGWYQEFGSLAFLGQFENQRCTIVVFRMIESGSKEFNIEVIADGVVIPQKLHLKDHETMIALIADLIR